MQYTKSSEIILVDGSTFLHEVVSNVIDGEPGLEIVAEIAQTDQFLQTAEELEPDWIYLLLEPRKEIPLTIQDYIEQSNKTRLLVMATDGSKVKVQSPQLPLQRVDARNLHDIINVLNSLDS